jgi:hypothetical protein
MAKTNGNGQGELPHAGGDMPHANAEVDTKAAVAMCIFITPEIAKEMLGRRRHQRPLNMAHVARLATQLDVWETNNDMIVFDSAGALLNGQHRLSAIATSGIGAWIYVVGRFKPKAFTTMDAGGRTRSGGDIVALLGGSNHVQSAAIVHLVVAHEQGLVTWHGWPRLTNREMEREYPKRKEMIDLAVQRGRGVPTALRIGTAVVGGAWYLFAQKDRATADAFIDVLKNGGTAVPAANALRESFIRRARARTRRLDGENFAIIVKCWNNHRTRKHVGRGGKAAPNYIRRDEGYPIISA